MSGLRLAFLGDPGSVHLHRWLAAFVARGHAVCLLEPHGHPADDAGPPAGVERLQFRSVQADRSPMGLWRARADLRRTLAAWRPHVLHAHYARSPAWHAWLSGWRPYVVTVWGSEVLRAAEMPRLGRLFTRLALRDAALVTAGTEQLAAAAVRLGARPERVRHAEFGIDTLRFHPGMAGAQRAELRAELGLGDARVVVSPRILAPLYRHEVVIEALARMPADVLVLSSGMRADPAERQRLEALARQLGVAERWRILPAMDADRMADLYRLADVVVSVPESDAMPQSVMEAMATGTPAVVSDLPDPRGWLGDLTPQLIVPVGDAAATAAAMQRALALSGGERRALGEELRQRVIERADATRSMDEVEGWYRELAEARHGRRGGRAGAG
ncbi:MAG TPA: glycosyltransferase [Candidatus Limnocylindria bacterium]